MDFNAVLGVEMGVENAFLGVNGVEMGVKKVL